MALFGLIVRIFEVLGEGIKVFGSFCDTSPKAVKSDRRLGFDRTFI